MRLISNGLRLIVEMNKPEQDYSAELRQRFALADALFKEPDFLLLHEPIGNLSNRRYWIMLNMNSFSLFVLIVIVLSINKRVELNEFEIRSLIFSYP